MVPQVQVTLGGGRCAPLQELVPGRKALHNQFFLFSNVTILSFKVCCLIWTLLNVEFSMFPPLFLQSTKHLI